MNRLELPINNYLQQSDTSCLAAAALISLNYLDNEKWKTIPENEKIIMENIRFSYSDNYGCYPKLAKWLDDMGYKVTYLLGSIPQLKDSPNKDIYDIWMSNYDKFIYSKNGKVNTLSDYDLNTLDKVLIEERVPIIFYSHKRWHNLLIYGKVDEANYLVMDPINGSKIYHRNNLMKCLRTPWGINALYVQNGRKNKENTP